MTIKRCVCGSTSIHANIAECRERAWWQSKQQHVEREARLANEATLIEADAEIGRLRERTAALSRIIRRTLACGQLEKLEDAKPYLDEP